MKKKWMRYIIFIFGFIMIVIVVRYATILIEYKSIANSNSYSWSVSQHPFYNEIEEKEFYFEESQLDLKLWWKGLTGDVEVILTDKDGKVYLDKKAKQIDKVFKIPMVQGKYKLK